MRHRRRGFVAISVLALMSAVLMVLPAGFAAATACDETYVQVSGDTIIVSPNGFDDTANLQCALDLGASMPWARVALEPGEYYTDFLEVEEFHGVLEGAGRLATSVMTLPDGLDCIQRSQQRRFVVLLAFGGGDVAVRDLTIGVGGRTSCEAPWLSLINDDGSGWVAWDLDIALQFTPGIALLGSCPAPGAQNVRVDGVGVDGIFPDYFQAFRVHRGFFAGLAAGGDALKGCPDSRSTGDVAITNSSFARMPQPVVVAWMDDSMVRFGAPGAGNHIRTAAQGLILQDMSNTHVVAEGNVIEDAWFFGLLGFARPDLVGEDPFTVEIRDNWVGGRVWADGVGVIDNAREVTGQTMIDAVIIDNTVHLAGTDYNAILASRAGGGEIVDNTITGAARVGVAVNADRWHVVGNDVSGFEAALADVWLTSGSARNRVRCSTPADVVLDEGSQNRVRGCSLLDVTSGVADMSDSELAVPDSLSASTKPEAVGEFRGALMR